MKLLFIFFYLFLLTLSKLAFGVDVSILQKNPIQGDNLDIIYTFPKETTKVNVLTEGYVYHKKNPSLKYIILAKEESQNTYKVIFKPDYEGFYNVVSPVFYVSTKESSYIVLGTTISFNVDKIPQITDHYYPAPSPTYRQISNDKKTSFYLSKIVFLSLFILFFILIRSNNLKRKVFILCRMIFLLLRTKKYHKKTPTKILYTSLINQILSLCDIFDIPRRQHKTDLVLFFKEKGLITISDLLHNIFLLENTLLFAPEHDKSTDLKKSLDLIFVFFNSLKFNIFLLVK